MASHPLYLRKKDIVKKDLLKLHPEVSKVRAGQLLPTILNLITLLDYDHVIFQEDKGQMAIDLADFTIDSINKWIAGQKEHGGRLKDRDIDKDMQQELIDMFHYMRVNSRKHKKKESI